jgi:calcineurin-like phosphoesterase
MKVLCIGDIFGQEGIAMVEKVLNKKGSSFDLIIANGENSADGFGITPEIAERLFSFGVDVITTGNHIWDKKEIHSYLDSNDRIIRPHNYPTANPGKGYVRIEINGKSVLVINLQGTVFLPALESPFVVV